MIPDRPIEPDTLSTDGRRSAVEVRSPWYRAVQASCIADVDLSVDGVAAPKDSLRWEMNGRTFRLSEFFGIDSRGEEPSVPVRELISLLVRNGYSGAISSEYEGWHWNYWDDAFEIIRAEQAVQRSAAEQAGSRMITDASEARTVLATHISQPAPASHR